MKESQSKIKILFILGGLGHGGIERQILNHFNLMDLSKFDPLILCLSMDSYKVKMENQLMEIGIPIAL